MLLVLKHINRMLITLRRRHRRSRTLMVLLICMIVFFVVSPFYVIYRPPIILVRYLQRRWPDILWHIQTTNNVVALTIDDAPSEHTPDIIRALKENYATATFFIIGSQVHGQKEKDMLKDIIRQGSELANHAMYDEVSKDLSNLELRQQVLQVEGMIREAYASVEEELVWAPGSMPPLYFRPGSGFFTKRMRKLMQDMGYKIVLGGIYPHDAQISWVWLNTWHVLSKITPGGIVICHDRRGWTAPMLRKVLPALTKQNYVASSLTGVINTSRLEDTKKEVDRHGNSRANR